MQSRSSTEYSTSHTCLLFLSFCYCCSTSQTINSYSRIKTFWSEKLKKNAKPILSFIYKWPYLKLVILFLYLLLTYTKAAMPASAMNKTTTPIIIPAMVADPKDDGWLSPDGLNCTLHSIMSYRILAFFQIYIHLVFSILFLRSFLPASELSDQS